LIFFDQKFIHLKIQKNYNQSTIKNIKNFPVVTQNIFIGIKKQHFLRKIENSSTNLIFRKKYKANRVAKAL
jgi:hypothetical protein